MFAYFSKTNKIFFLSVPHETVFWGLETLLFLEAGNGFQSENVALTN